jgi:hypothetical protein
MIGLNGISKPLAHIFNLTFTTGIIQEELKIALVTPIYIKRMRLTS